MNRSDDIGTIEPVSLLAGVIIRVQRKWLSALKGGDAIELPATRRFLHESVLNVAIEGKLPDSADDQALGHIEIRERAVQPGVERVSVSGGARAETGT